MKALMETDAKNTEMEWKISLEYLDRVLKSYWTGLDTNPVADYDTYDIYYDFKRNELRDILSDLKDLKQAGGMLPQKELFQKFGYDENIAEELAEEASNELSESLPEIGV
jgi:hypothetical protein